MNQATRDTYKTAETLKGFKGQLAKFDKFPLPTEETIAAGGLLQRALKETNAPAAGAVAVVQTASAGRTTFYTVASGGATVSDAAFKKWEKEVAETFGNTFTTASAVNIDSAALFYSPAHKTTSEYIKTVFRDFAIPANPLDLANLQGALNLVNALPAAEYGMTTAGVQANPLTPVITAIGSLLAVGLAMRVGCFKRTDLPQARTLIEEFVNKAEKLSYKGPKDLAKNMEALALAGGNPNQYLYREDPGLTVSSVSKVQAKVKAAWLCADLSRYCAEPKVFTYLKTYGVKDPVVGQLAMWYDTRANNYKFAGSEEGAYSNYMLPCTSCMTRSGEMISGITVATPSAVVREEPFRVQAPTTTRTRSASFSG